MANYSILVHISNAEPVKIDVEELPTPADTCIIGKNPRERSDKELTWLDEGVTMVVFPWWRINYIQILPNQEEQLEFPLPFKD
ncbi:MAG: hypothetical protein H7Y09_00430 [Chitinophagaceae bacterium]|nr:hypothetical protein [Anaerolineae bacterium]